MPLERSDVRHPLWRKKVDGSLLRHAETPIPGWVIALWELQPQFPHKGSRGDPRSVVTLRFQGHSFTGAVTWQGRTKSARRYRLWFEDSLRYALADTFVMSHMRYLEKCLRATGGDSSDVEKEIPFWEFLDVEYARATKTFHLKAYYVQRPAFRALFSRMSDGPPLKSIRDELAGKTLDRIYKQIWKPRKEFETEFGATNVLYMLADTRRRELYIGEAGRLIARLRRGHDLIPGWDYYRYDALPAALSPYRLQLERMLIRDLYSLLDASAAGLPVQLSQFKLVNVRIDR